MSVESPDAPGSIVVFYSYAPRDEALRDELEKHLGALKRLRLISDWHNRDIQIGTDWRREVDVHLDAANIILLLISSDYMDSDYCYSIEMQRALEKHKQGKARVIPIILRPVDLEGTPIASLRVLPSSGKPITSWSNQDAAFTDVSKGIRKVILELKTESTTGLLSFSGKKEAKISIDESVKNLSPTSNKMTGTIFQESFSDEQEFSHYATIDTNEVITYFQNLIRPDSRIHVLRLVGEAKLGKSHLLTKVFPSIIGQSDQVRYTVLDMRNRMYAVPDILHMACNSFDSDNFDFYHASYHEWNSQRKAKPRRSQTQQIMEQDVPEEIQERDRNLTFEFVRDLSKLDDKLLLFLFDSVNNASEYMQTWLANTFLPHITRTAHVRTVVAGRFLPDIHGSYALYCENYQLRAMTDAENFISYCRELNARLEEQSIRDFAFACDYVPGMFVELVYPKFIKVRT